MTHLVFAPGGGGGDKTSRWRRGAAHAGSDGDEFQKIESDIFIAAGARIAQGRLFHNSYDFLQNAMLADRATDAAASVAGDFIFPGYKPVPPKPRFRSSLPNHVTAPNAPSHEPAAANTTYDGLPV